MSEAEAFAGQASDLRKHQGLAYLQKVVDATSVIWLDADGHIRSVDGNTEILDLASISVLAAGVMAAASGLKQLFGKGKLHRMSLESTHMTLHFQCVLPDSLFVVACPATTPLGLIRLHARRAAEILSQTSSVAAPSCFSADNLYRASA